MLGVNLTYDTRKDIYSCVTGRDTFYDKMIELDNFYKSSYNLDDQIKRPYSELEDEFKD